MTRALDILKALVAICWAVAVALVLVLFYGEALERLEEREEW